MNFRGSAQNRQQKQREHKCRNDIHGNMRLMSLQNIELALCDTCIFEHDIDTRQTLALLRKSFHASVGGQIQFPHLQNTGSLSAGFDVTQSSFAFRPCSASDNHGWGAAAHEVASCLLSKPGVCAGYYNRFAGEGCGFGDFGRVEELRFEEGGKRWHGCFCVWMIWESDSYAFAYAAKLVGELSVFRTDREDW